MTRDEIVAKVLEAVADEADKPAAEILPEHRFAEDLAFDSLAQVELVMKLEDEFELTIPDDQVEKLKSVGDVIEYIAANEDKASAA